VGRSDEEERETKPARDRFALKNTRERASEMMNTRGDRGDASGAREVMSPWFVYVREGKRWTVQFQLGNPWEAASCYLIGRSDRGCDLLSRNI
jgi:hypothetical protein